MFERLTFGFHNPNHAAALVCALLPLCLGWRRAAWAGRGLADRSQKSSPKEKGCCVTMKRGDNEK